MFRLGARMLFSRKKWLLIMTFSIAIAIASITSIFTASQFVKKAVIDKAEEMYGSHTGFLTDVSATKQKMLKENKKIAVGEYEILGKMNINDNVVATVGWMDKDAIAIGNLKLNDGRFPRSFNEVAIESAYLKGKLKHWKIGEKRRLTVGNKKISLTLVGIVENYSAQWSVPVDFEKGVNDFPNIFVSKKAFVENNNTHNFLVRFSGNSQKASERMSTLLDLYNQQGNPNSQLFNNGLNLASTITFLSVFFQIFILLLSLFSISTLFLYFIRNQHKKIGIMKAVGFNNRTLYKLYIYQTLIIFLLSSICSIPFVFLFQKLIIHFFYRSGFLDFLFFIKLVAMALIIYVMFFAILLTISLTTVKKANHLTVNELLTSFSTSKSNKYYDSISKYFNSFYQKQLAKQVLMYPRQFILIILIVSFSVLTFIFANYFQKENLYGWDNIKSKYYLNSQQLFGFEIVQNLKVLHRQGLIYSINDVEQLEKHPGVLYIEKIPFMEDVETLIDLQAITPSLTQWIYHTDSHYKKYEGKVIIPNVRYVIFDKHDMNDLITRKKYRETKEKVIIFNPIHSNSEEEKSLIGKNISLIKMYNSSSGRKVKEKDLEVLDVMNEPYTYKINQTTKMKNEDYLTIAMDKETAIESGLFKGYSELYIFTKKDLSQEKSTNLDKQVKNITSTVPGSLMEDITSVIRDNANLFNLFKVFGALLFFVSILLTTISMTIILFSKYQLQKRNWGIYLSLGMSKKNISTFFFCEMLIYIVISMIFSWFIFSVAIFILHPHYSYFFYAKYFFLAYFIIFCSMLIGGALLKSIIKKQSIASILRREE
ncbi:FtsX-like permease family protein [Heyndrickxia ginsengihumi]|uniref:ABC transporter permease n=1 Tax=Heyndrickxia ginsengihumi TaxID=363870 RepID=UPI003D21A3D8